MRVSIRWRIGAWMFLLVVGLQLAETVYVLYRLRRVQRSEVNLLLIEEMTQAQALIGTSQLAKVLEHEAKGRSKWNEKFLEVRGPGGELVAASRNLPESGFEPPESVEYVTGRSGPTLAVWDQIHPRSQKGHVRIRVGEAQVGPYTVRVARTLKRYQKTWWRLREQMMWGVLAVSGLTAAVAWAVARRALAPVQEIAQTASVLGGASTGELPRTGSGDEIDELAGVLNGLLGRIREEAARIRRLTADAAHALRTPLAAIRGQLEVDLNSAGPDEAVRIGCILEMMDETVVLVNRMLMLARLESGTLENEMEPLQLDELVRDVADAVSILAQDRDIDLSYKVDRICVKGDRSALRNALLNLIDNAIRHTPAGGAVRIETRSGDEWALVAVEDSGPGFAPGDTEELFARFHSRRDGPPGSGLGLAIARAVAEAHGGRLEANGERGGRFFLRLPRHIEE